MTTDPEEPGQQPMDIATLTRQLEDITDRLRGLSRQVSTINANIAALLNTLERQPQVASVPLTPNELF